MKVKLQKCQNKPAKAADSMCVIAVFGKNMSESLNNRLHVEYV